MPEEISVEVRGIAPLVQNKFIEDKSETSRRKQKTYDDNEELEKRTYKNNKGELIQPAIHIKSSMVKSATAFKFEGKKTYKDIIRAGIIIDPSEIVHLNQKYEIDKRSVVIQRSRIMRVRPILNEWGLKFKIINLQPENLSKKVIKDILTDSGKYTGIGDMRPEYGRFEIVKFK